MPAAATAPAPRDPSRVGGGCRVRAGSGSCPAADGHPAHIRTAGGQTQPPRKDREDLVGEVEQTGGTAITEASPFLGGDVIRDRQLGSLPSEPCPQPHWPRRSRSAPLHQGPCLRQCIHPSLKPRRGKNQRHGLPEADRPHWRSIGDQGSPRRLHAATQASTSRSSPRRSASARRARINGHALQITGNFSGADRSRTIAALHGHRPPSALTGGGFEEPTKVLGGRRQRLIAGLLQRIGNHQVRRYIGSRPPEAA